MPRLVDLLKALTEPEYDRLRVYERGQIAGVSVLSIAGIISLIAVLFVALFKRPSPKTSINAQIYGYFAYLLISNTLQAIGTVMNFAWVAKGWIEIGPTCTAQGAIKQIGNLGNATWTLAIAVYLFQIIFMRVTTNRYIFISASVVGWGLIGIIVMVGPLAIQNEKNGPYFGISGAWCWITREYPKSQIYAEYFPSYVSAIISFLLYTAILLRVRGNLTKVGGKWRLQFLSAGDSWKLNLSRDLIDNGMGDMVKRMIWYPVAYTIVLVPLTLARLSEFAGARVPFGVTITTAIIYNLIGFINVVLLLITRRLIPDPQNLPNFSTQRQRISVGLSLRGGVSPFLLEKSEVAEKYNTERAARLQANGSIKSNASTDLSRSNTTSSTATLDVEKGVEADETSAGAVGRPPGLNLQESDRADGVQDQEDGVPQRSPRRDSHHSVLSYIEPRKETM